MTTLTVRISPNVRARLAKLSRRRHVRVSDLVRESLDRFLVAEQFRELRQSTLPLAEARGYLTDEDIFKAVS